MTRKITIASHKGGVGKSTVVYNLAVALQRLGEQVLIVEGDPQGGLTALCKKSGRIAPGIVQVWREEQTIDSVILPLKGEGLAILETGITSSEDVRFFEEQAGSGALSRLLSDLPSGYDYVLYDAPVGIGVVTRELLAASDTFVQVVDCRFATVRTMDRLLKFSVWVKKNINQALDLEGVLVNMHNPDSIREKKIVNRIKTRFPARWFFKTDIHSDSAYEKAATSGVPVESVEGGQNAARNFFALAAEIAAGAGGRHETQVGQAGLVLDEDVGESEFGYHSDREQAGEKGERFGGDDRVTKILREMCEKSDITGAVVADEMGFPLADYHCPLRVEALATCSSLLGESLKSIGGILEMPEANNLVMDLNQQEKMLLHGFTVMGDMFFLVLVVPHGVENALGEVRYAAERIADVLAG